MSGTVVVGRLRRGVYLDSVALMRLSQRVSSLPGVELAALVIGTDANKRVLEEAGLLTEEARSAGANDIVISLRARTGEAGAAALREAEALLDAPALQGEGASEWRPKTLESALEILPGANLALVSVPGEFAGEEARRALRRGLHVMLFSDNVPLEQERALKEEARERGLLLMGPDCGTAILGGVPLAFANEVPRGEIGLAAASGTGLQEVACLIGRGGAGISHAIGVGGRDLSDAVGGIMMLASIDALDEDPGTRRIVLISKPPGPAVAERVLERVSRSAKSFIVCFLGAESAAVPANAVFTPTLAAAAEEALGRALDPMPGAEGAAQKAAARLGAGRRWIRGLYSGGTLCAEAQVVLRAAGERVFSNVPVQGVKRGAGAAGAGHTLLDLGADEYTRGRPHPMIEPSIRHDALAEALSDPGAAAVLLDVVIGHGAHEDPAGALAGVLLPHRDRGAAVVASVCGTEADPQVFSEQVRKLEEAGVIVAASNARAAELALSVARRFR